MNPRASRVTEPLVERVARELQVDDVLRTERARHATELASSLTEVDRIYVFSGDGGFNEVLNGAPPGVALGFVPGGGTNVLSRALGLPRDPVQAARRLAAGEPRRISLGRANGRRFGFSAGLGLDAEFIRRMDARGRDATGKRPGDLMFLWTIVQTLASHRVRFDPALEIAGSRDRGLRARRELRAVHLRQPPAASAAARRELRGRARPPRAACVPAAPPAGGDPLPAHRTHPDPARVAPRPGPDRAAGVRADAAAARRRGSRRRDGGRARGGAGRRRRRGLT